MKGFLRVLLTIVCAIYLVACTTTGATKTESVDQLKGPVPVIGNPDHDMLLYSSDPKLAANKRVVYDLWRTLLDAHDIQRAKKYLAEGYIQHNPMVSTGRQAILDLVSSFGAPSPVADQIKGEVVAIVAERDLVVLVQVSKKDKPKPYTTTWFDMFRVENGVVTEHWDHGTLSEKMTPQAYIPPQVNLNPAASIASDEPQLQYNKQRVYDMWRILLDAQQIDKAPEFLAVDYIQHNPMVNTGLAGFVSTFEQFAQPRSIQPEVKNFVEIVAEGNLVVLATVATYKDANDQPYTTTWFDMFRVEGDKIVEHWDTATIPEHK